MARRGGIQVRVQGDKEIDEALRRLGPTVRNRALRPALRDGGALLQKEIRARAPDGDDPPHPKYGSLRQNIRVTVDRRITDKVLVATVHTGKAFWARFLEYGTVVRRPRKRDGVMANKRTGEFFGREAGAMPRTPFFRPAFDSKATEALVRIRDRLAREIQDVARLITPRRRGRR